MNKRVQHVIGIGVAALATGLAGCSAEDPTPGSPPPATSAPVPTTVTAPSTPASTPAPRTTSAPASTPATTPPATTAAAPTTVRPPHGQATVIADDLELPWSVAFVGDVALFSQRDRATVSAVIGGRVVEVGQVPGVVPGGEGGLLGLAVSPDIPDTLFAYLTAEEDNRVVRMTLTRTGDSFTLGAPQPIVTGIPKAGNHNGGRIRFGPDGMLYVGTGDAANTRNSQDPASLGGKILRVSPTGEIPADNPYGTLVWSLGHRNVQGLAWSADGTMWASEFGQNTFDELNVIISGGNYGWPSVEGTSEDDANFVNPVATWGTDDASPSGLLQLDGTLYMAALRGERLWVMPAVPERAGAEATALLAGGSGFGRLRDVVAAPDGTIWLLTSNGSGDSIVSFAVA